MGAETVAVPHIQVCFIYGDDSLNVHCNAMPRIGEQVHHPNGRALIVANIVHTIREVKGGYYQQVQIVLEDRP